MPAERNEASAQSIALAISGEPVTRPPISSVRRRRFSSIGEGPMTWGRILAAASAQEASVAEQAWGGGSIAQEESPPLGFPGRSVRSRLQRASPIRARIWGALATGQNFSDKIR